MRVWFREKNRSNNRNNNNKQTKKNKRKKNKQVKSRIRLTMKPIYKVYGISLFNKHKYTSNCCCLRRLDQINERTKNKNKNKHTHRTVTCALLSFSH